MSINPDLFDKKLLKLVKKEKRNQTQILGRQSTNIRDFFIRFFSSKLTIIALLVFIGIIIASLVIYYNSSFTEESQIHSYGKNSNGEWDYLKKAKIPQVLISNLPPSSENGGNVTKIVSPSQYQQILSAIGQDHITSAKPIAVNQILIIFNPYDYLKSGNAESLITGGTKNFIIGTNEAGQDNWTRVWFGTLESLKLAVLVAVVETFIGVVVGAYIGFYAGTRKDNYLMRLIDIIASIPSLLWFILLAFVLGTGFWSLFLALVLVSWTPIVVQTRMYMLKIKNLDFIDAAKTIGISTFKLIYFYALPYALGRLLSAFVRRIPYVIIIQASIAFLGFSSSTAANLGAIINDAKSSIGNNVLYIITPISIIFAITLSLQLVANGVNTALDPKGVK